MYIYNIKLQLYEINLLLQHVLYATKIYEHSMNKPTTNEDNQIGVTMEQEPILKSLSMSSYYISEQWDKCIEQSKYIKLL